jgi:hypothetical protein
MHLKFTDRLPKHQTIHTSGQYKRYFKYVSFILTSISVCVNAVCTSQVLLHSGHKKKRK